MSPALRKRPVSPVSAAATLAYPHSGSSVQVHARLVMAVSR